jgi:hypothetical protein
VGTVVEEIESIDTTTTAGPPTFDINSWLTKSGLDSITEEEGTN